MIFLFVITAINININNTRVIDFSHTYMDYATLQFNEGLGNKSTHTLCAKALAFMMRADYDDDDIAQLLDDLLAINARKPHEDHSKKRQCINP